MEGLSPEEFYRRRGDRTRRLAPNLAYQNKPLGLVASTRYVTSRHGQAMILTAANLLARWGRTLLLEVPDSRLLIQRGQCNSLHQRLRLEIREANPHCSLEFGTISPDAITLAIGAVASPRAASFAVGVSGWDAIGWNPQKYVAPPDLNGSSVFLPAALLAAVLGVAQVFKVAIEQHSEDLIDSLRWSLWMHEFSRDAHIPIGPVPDVSLASGPLGRVLQVGVGAVGSNVLYFLGMLDEALEFVIVDNDVVELENLDRSLLFGVSDAYPTAIPKVVAAARILAELGTASVEPFACKWSEYVDENLSNERGDVWLALANEDGAWRSMAENLPPLVLEGTTSDDWGFTVGRHIPFRDYCLRCRFPPSGEPVFACSSGELPSTSAAKDDEVHAALPFLSAASAVLVTAEVLKLRVPQYVDCPNYIEGNLLGPLTHILTLRRSPGSDCSVCTRRSKSLWRRVNHGTLHSEIIGA